MNESQASSRANKSFEQMMAIAEFAAKGHSERRQVVFRVFVSYMTLLVVIAGLIMKHWKDEMIRSWEAAIPISAFLLIVMVVYCIWIYWIYGALIYDVRRRDFYLTKAEIICFYHRSKWILDALNFETHLSVVRYL